MNVNTIKEAAVMNVWMMWVVSTAPALIRWFYLMINSIVEVSDWELLLQCCLSVPFGVKLFFENSLNFHWRVPLTGSSEWSWCDNDVKFFEDQWEGWPCRHTLRWLFKPIHALHRSATPWVLVFLSKEYRYQETCLFSCDDHKSLRKLGPKIVGSEWQYKTPKE